MPSACALRVTSEYSFTDLGRMDSWIDCWLVISGSNDGFEPTRVRMLRNTAPWTTRPYHPCGSRATQIPSMLAAHVRCKYHRCLRLTCDANTIDACGSRATQIPSMLAAHVRRKYHRWSTQQAIRLKRQHLIFPSRTFLISRSRLSSFVVYLLFL